MKYSLKEFRGRFKKHFPELNPNQYLDLLVWQINREVTVDIIKLDNWLHSKYGNYEKRNISMAQALTKFVSQEASDFIGSLFELKQVRKIRKKLTLW